MAIIKLRAMAINKPNIFTSETKALRHIFYQAMIG
jgi:hypothetical protein